jgi:hypothetical protein
MTTERIMNIKKFIKDTPWGQEIDYYERETGRTFEESSDLTILRYLIHGDTRPLASFFEGGFTPGPVVLKYLSAMLYPIDGTEKTIPFKIKLKTRLGQKGRRHNPENDWRDFLIGINAMQIAAKNGPGGYDATIAEVSDMLPGERNKKQTIRDAYDFLRQKLR